jgi:hypothetical protein
MRTPTTPPVIESCPVCKLAIHPPQRGNGILIQASIGTFTSGHSHAICECGWWVQTETVEAVHAAVAAHEGFPHGQ